MFDLTGQVAIVTGGARGIGEGICQVFTRAGATVYMWDVLDEGEEAAQKIAETGANITFQKVDITSRKAVQESVEAIMQKEGRIDILINNAGIIRDRSLQKMTEDEWNAVINVNINSLFVTTKAVLPYMKEAKYGRIINASSINAVAGAFGQTNYSASKAAIQGFTRALCKEVGRYNITVNCVAPGFVKSVMSDSMPEQVIQAGIAMIPVGRIGTPEDMGHVYLFLASKEAAFVSGHTLHANGGAYPT
ncbi:MAG: 3-oxoacyl-ACP reductase FabG [Bacteroidota bacterium]